MQIINCENLQKEKVCNDTFGYIYITTNTSNGKRYIGQRRAFEGDISEDKYLGSGTLLQRAVKKYGEHCFKKEIIEYCNSIEELNDAEQKWISFYDAVRSDMFYNIAAGGAAGDTWTGRTDEEKDRFRDAIRVSNHQRKRNADNIKGSLNPAFGKRWCNDGKRNYLLMEDEIVSNGFSHGMIRTKEHNYKIAMANKGKKHNYSSTRDRHCYNDGKSNRFLLSDEIKDYEANGWRKGMIHTDRRKQ